MLMKSRREKKHNLKRQGADEWHWEDESTLIRIHNEPRRKLFIPKEAEFLPCSLRRIRDDRETTQIFQSSQRTIKDSWRMAGNNIESTNRRNEFWTGKPIFKVIPNMKWNSTMVDESDTEDAGSCGEFIVTCTHAERMDIIPLDKMFIGHQYRLKHVKCNEHDWDIKMTLHRSNGKKLVYHFRKSPYDILASLFRNHETVLDIYEMSDDVPCLLLMCAEEQSLITQNYYKDKFKLMHVVTITEDGAPQIACSSLGRVQEDHLGTA
eukprot:s934_g3.t2